VAEAVHDHAVLDGVLHVAHAVHDAGPKLRGKRQLVTSSLPPELVPRVDAKAAKERRSRANMIEVLLEESLGREVPQAEAS